MAKKVKKNALARRAKAEGESVQQERAEERMGKKKMAGKKK